MIMDYVSNGNVVIAKKIVRFESDFDEEQW